MHLFIRSRNAVLVLTSGLSKSRLSAATALDKPGSLAHCCRSIHAVSHEILGYHQCQQRFLGGILGSADEYSMLGRLGTNTKRYILHNLGKSDAGKLDHLDAVDLTSLGKEFVSEYIHTLLEVLLGLMLQLGILVD